MIYLLLFAAIIITSIITSYITTKRVLQLSIQNHINKINEELESNTLENQEDAADFWKPKGWKPEGFDEPEEWKSVP